MLGRLLPREEKFFELFRQAADLIVEGAKEFREMLSDLPNAESRAKAIKFIEHQADEVTHRTVALLHKTFITPLDREDIHQLISRMDDILDQIEAASERIYLYQVTSAPPEAIALADICVRSVENIKQAVNRLEDLKNTTQIIAHCVEVNRLENEADNILRAAIAKLFREEPDTRQLIKLKEVFELLETVTDRCEDVANIVEGIVLEYA
jgi:predicted phosphate transport protein (TIGR00153 family)